LLSDAVPFHQAALGVRVIEENERFATVDTFHGVPARIARDTNPRR
jgi:hypothetical protein